MATTATKRRHRASAAYLAERADREEAATREIADPDSPIMARLASGDPEICERVRGYSLRNQVMLAQQAAEKGVSLREIGTFADWTERGRRIITGQHGMRINRFRGEDEAKDGKARYGVLVLFSIDQTRPADANCGDTPDEQAAPVAPAAVQPPADAARPVPQRLHEALAARVRAAGFELVDDPDQTAPIHIDHGHKRVCLRPDDMSPETLRDLAATLANLVGTPQ